MIIKPTVVCLCGSTRFHKHLSEATLRETFAGKIVLTPGTMTRSDEEDGLMFLPEWPLIKARLDELHLRKIDISDEILVIDVNCYIGESTTREIAYARQHNKRIRYLSKENSDNEWTGE